MPWGRSLDEYVRMFDLRESDLARRILDCAAGPAAFNAEMHRRGRAVISCDPIYEFSAAEIAKRIDGAYDAILKATERNCEKFVWRAIDSPEHLGKLRMDAMKQFLADFPIGLPQGRYRAGELPSLPFRDREFDLALCSHFLFTYSDILTLEFHLASIRELCRVAGEARIFPLLPSFGDAHSPHVAAVVSQLGAEAYRCELRRVPYEFQKGGNEMLRVSCLRS
jgi:SAM-dependent methyltransferase